MERQAHGFAFEDRIIKKLSLSKSDNYTAKWDAFYGDIPVQIKCIKYKSAIDLGDVYRQGEITSRFILIVGFWDDEKSNIVDIQAFDLQPGQWSNMFPNLTAIKEAFNNLRSLVGNDPEMDTLWKTECKKIKTTFNSKYITLNPKRDHKSQYRQQCSISWSNWQKLTKILNPIFKEEFDGNK